jgi:hypothetical protein
MPLEQGVHLLLNGTEARSEGLDRPGPVDQGVTINLRMQVP